MSAIDQIQMHRSVRAFTDKPVSPEILDRILGAAIRAPTGGGMQLYAMITTLDPERKNALAEMHFRAEAIRQAPVVISFCVDCNRTMRWMALQGEKPNLAHMWGFALGFCDTMLAAQNAVLAAESLGLGTCFLGSTFAAASTLTRFLECPPNVVPVATLVIGHPAEQSVGTTTRLPLNIVVHRERYERCSDQQLLAAYADHERAMFSKYRSLPTIDAAVDALGIASLAQLYGRMEYSAELVETAGAYFMAVVQEQGFLSNSQLDRMRFVRNAAHCPVAELPALRQLVFAVCLVSGSVDDLLSFAPEKAEAVLHQFVTSREPVFYQDLRALFDPSRREQLLALAKQIDPSLVRAA